MSVVLAAGRSSIFLLLENWFQPPWQNWKPQGASPVSGPGVGISPAGRRGFRFSMDNIKVKF
jgi:hypothetical protein